MPPDEDPARGRPEDRQRRRSSAQSVATRSLMANLAALDARDRNARAAAAAAAGGHPSSSASASTGGNYSSHGNPSDRRGAHHPTSSQQPIFERQEMRAEPQPTQPSSSSSYSQQQQQQQQGQGRGYGTITTNQHHQHHQHHHRHHHSHRQQQAQDSSNHRSIGVQTALREACSCAGGDGSCRDDPFWTCVDGAATCCHTCNEGGGCSCGCDGCRCCGRC